jgi:hypothetical protein
VRRDGVSGPGEEYDHDWADHREMGDREGVEFVTKDSTAVLVEIEEEIWGVEGEDGPEVTHNVGCFF